MTSNKPRQPAGDGASDEPSESGKLNPRDTDHPTGPRQAADNAAADPPG